MKHSVWEVRTKYNTGSSILYKITIQDNDFTELFGLLLYIIVGNMPVLLKMILLAQNNYRHTLEPNKYGWLYYSH